MHYYRKSTSNNGREDLKLLNNHVNTIYNELNNYIDERDNLLSLFNNKIIDNIPDENILYENIDVDPDNEFKEIFYANQNHQISINIFFIYLSKLIIII